MFAEATSIHAHCDNVFLTSRLAPSVGKMFVKSALWIVTIAASTGSILAHGSGVRGVPPDRLSLYQGSSAFTCISDGTIIPAARINDDFCDCHDGTDEPGTSACPNGEFYCPNRGFQPRILAAAFVNDGVCDCCDGSDEDAGRCDNTCAQQGATMLQSKQLLLDSHRAGAEQRVQLLHQAEKQRQEWIQEEARLKKAIDEVKPSVERLKAAKEAVEAEIAELEQQAKDASEPAAAWQDPRDPESWDLDEDDDSLLLSDLSHGAEDYEDVDSTGPDVQVDTMEEDDPEAVGRRIAAQWTSDPDAALRNTDAGQGSPNEAAPSGGVTKAEGASGSASDAAADAEPGAALPVTDAITGGLSLKSALARVQQVASEAVRKVGGMMGAQGPTSGTGQGDAAAPASPSPSPLEGKRTELDAAREAYNAVKANFNRLQKSQSDLISKLGQDHGPAGIFTYMADQCWSTQVDKYTYRVCPQGKAHQIEGGSEVLLGTFSGYADNHTVMEFTQGTSCWQGPARSIKVTLRCGSETQLSQVDEPERCSYVAILDTPALCDAALIDSLQAEIDDLTPDVRDEL